MSQHLVSLRVYFGVFTALLVLTSATVWAAFLDLGPMNTVVALSIATVKALLVVLYFMHVRYSSRLVWLFAASGFFWLVLLVGFTFSDFLTRDAVIGLGP